MTRNLQLLEFFTKRWILKQRCLVLIIEFFSLPECLQPIGTPLGTPHGNTPIKIEIGSPSHIYTLFSLTLSLSHTHTYTHTYTQSPHSLSLSHTHTHTHTHTNKLSHIETHAKDSNIFL